MLLPKIPKYQPPPVCLGLASHSHVKCETPFLMQMLFIVIYFMIRLEYHVLFLTKLSFNKVLTKLGLTTCLNNKTHPSSPDLNFGFNSAMFKSFLKEREETKSKQMLYALLDVCLRDIYEYSMCCENPAPSSVLVLQNWANL